MRRDAAPGATFFSLVGEMITDLKEEARWLAEQRRARALESARLHALVTMRDGPWLEIAPEARRVLASIALSHHNGLVRALAGYALSGDPSLILPDDIDGQHRVLYRVHALLVDTRRSDLIPAAWEAIRREADRISRARRAALVPNP